MLVSQICEASHGARSRSSPAGAQQCAPGWRDWRRGRRARLVEAVEYTTGVLLVASAIMRQHGRALALAAGPVAAVVTAATTVIELELEVPAAAAAPGQGAARQPKE
jgi:hypothetical protein